jgi:hypothetical protein
MVIVGSANDPNVRSDVGRYYTLGSGMPPIGPALRDHEAVVKYELKKASDRQA